MGTNFLSLRTLPKAGVVTQSREGPSLTLVGGGGLKLREPHKLISRAAGDEVPLLTRAFARHVGVHSLRLTWDPSRSLNCQKCVGICTSLYEDTVGISAEGPVSPGEKRGTRGWCGLKHPHGL